MSGTYAVVLGTAQDGGLPQIGCEERPCVEAQHDPSRRRFVASLLVVDPRRGLRWLVDAGPDLDEHVQRARGHPPGWSRPGARPPLFDGIFLTHAHLGHVSGLLHLGREAYGSREQPVFATPRLQRFLEGNAPWSLLVEARHLSLRPLAPDVPVELGEGLSVTPIAVPHRDEFSDTVGFVIRGPRRALLYLPDIDKWERWERGLERSLAEVDLALVDGTFFADGEVPGRAMAEIPHPFIVETLARLAPLPAAERAKVLFTHLNHTNPAADPRSPEAARIVTAGCAVAREGQILDL